MDSKIKTEKKKIKEEGFFSVFKKGFKYHFFLLLYLPLLFLKVKRFKSKEIHQLLNFVFIDTFGYLAPIQVRTEIASLLEVVTEIKPKAVMEIGTARGGTLFLFSKLADDNATIISVDFPKGKFGNGYRKWRILLYKSFAKGNQKIYLLRDDSHNIKTLDKTKEILSNRKLDFLFIDADHTYEGVKRDFELYKPLVKKGGIIAFHDIAPGPIENVGGVPEFWNEIKINYEHKEFIEDRKQNWAGIGLIKV